MKKLAIYLAGMILSMTVVSTQLKAVAETGSITTVTNVKEERAKTLLIRLDEIKALDKSKLSSAEKRELRKEVRSIKKELTELNDGIYISFGLIIIVLLLIILL